MKLVPLVVGFRSRRKLTPLDPWEESLMRKRHQKGSLKIKGGSWIAQWWGDGPRRNRVLGKRRKMTKSEAEDRLSEIVGPLNIDRHSPSSKTTFDDFVNHIYRS